MPSDIRLLREDEVPVRDDDFVGRGSVPVFAIGLVIFAALTVALLAWPSVQQAMTGHSEGIRFIAYPGGLFMLLLTWLTWRAFKALRAPTNWLLRAAMNGLYIRYRSPLNGDYPGEPVAAFVPRRLVRHITTTIEKRPYIDTDGHRTAHRVPSLDIHLRDAGLDRLKQAINRERSRRTPAGAGTGTRSGTRGKFLHYPVRVLSDEVIRIEWRTPQFVTTPRLAMAAAILSKQYLRVGTKPTREAPASAEDSIITLAQSGNIVQATKLAKETCSLSTTEAKQFVDGLLR